MSVGQAHIQWHSLSQYILSAFKIDVFQHMSIIFPWLYHGFTHEIASFIHFDPPKPCFFPSATAPKYHLGNPHHLLRTGHQLQSLVHLVGVQTSSDRRNSDVSFFFPRIYDKYVI